MSIDKLSIQMILLHLFPLRRDGVLIDLLDGFADAQPKGQIRKYLHDAALVREGRFLEDGEVFQ